MQIVLVGQLPRLWSPGNFQWPIHTARALCGLGHRVTVVAYRESWASSPALAHTVGAAPALSRRLAAYCRSRQQRRDRRLIRTIRHLRPDVILFLNGDTFSGEVLAALKRAAPGRMVSWWADDPCSAVQFMAHAALFDHVFLFDRAYLEAVKAAGAPQAHFLPCACDETVYRPLPLRAAERRRFACDISFVAWYYPERAAVVKALAPELDVAVWGGGWDRPEAQQALGGRRVARGRAVGDRVAAKIYNASKIGLNIHATHSRLAGVNTRTFELLASGLFQLADHIEGIEELLQPGEEIVCYGSPEEARRLAVHYLADTAARRQIAARGRARVLDEHTYTHRMRTLLARLS